jgi:hypothetical protein
MTRCGLSAWIPSSRPPSLRSPTSPCRFASMLHSSHQIHMRLRKSSQTLRMMKGKIASHPYAGPYLTRIARIGVVRWCFRFSPLPLSVQGLLVNVGYQKIILQRQPSPSASQVDERNGEMNVPFFVFSNHTVLSA